MKAPIAQIFLALLSVNSVCAFDCPIAKSNQELIDAIHRNRTDMIDAIYATTVPHPSLEQFTNNKSPLHRAIESGKDSMVRHLLNLAMQEDSSAPKRLIEAGNLNG
ncbi:MAG: hypothetical protein EA369_09740 [Bradymonadales bacterium]|nr:MAG: hypothetical protein EA369_09740 [Bradymonadales bacterium]